MGNIEYIKIQKSVNSYVNEKLSLYETLDLTEKIAKRVIKNFHQQLDAEKKDKKFTYEAKLLFSIMLEHYTRISLLEEKYSKLEDRNFVEGKLKNGKNIGFMHFFLRTKGKSISMVKYYSHSTIHSGSLELKHLEPHISDFFCDKQDGFISNSFKNGYTNNNNNALFYHLNDSNVYNNYIAASNPIKILHLGTYKRDIDTEAKMISAFLKDFTNTNIKGDLILFTQKKPCLSCERNIFTLSQTFNDINIKVYFGY